MANDLQTRAAMCEVGRWLWQRNLIGAIEGNMVVRIGKNELLCTPAGRNKGMLKPDDLLIVDMDGVPKSGGNPSSEIKLHLEVFAQRSDCVASIHAHPPYATVLATIGETIPDNILPEAAIVLGSVALVPFAMPGTEETRTVIRPYLEFHKTFLLSNHGALALGKDIYDAFARIETLERVATVLHLANVADAPTPLSTDAFNYLLENALNAKL
jgi:L-fuculose-phosphate aldolase